MCLIKDDKFQIEYKCLTRSPCSASHNQMIMNPEHSFDSVGESELKKDALKSLKSHLNVTGLQSKGNYWSALASTPAPMSNLA